MVIKYSCNTCEHAGTIDFVRQYSERFHTRTLKAHEESELATRDTTHKKDTSRFHTLTGIFTLPTSIRRLPDGWLERKPKLLK